MGERFRPGLGRFSAMTTAGAGSSTATDRLALLGEVVRSFADATTDYPRLLETIATRTATLLGHYCSIRLLSDDGGTLETAAMCDPVDGKSSAMSAAAARPLAVAESPVLQELLTTGRSFLVAEAPTDEVTRPFEPSGRAAVAALGIRSIIVAPLHARGRTYGALFVVRRGSSTTLARDDLDLAEALARHAALAISNARMLQELTREVEQRERAQSSLEIAEVARQYEKSIVDTISHPLLVLGPDQRVRSANRSFFELFRTTEADVVDRRVTEIASRALDVPRLHELLGEVLPVRKGALVTDVQIEVTTPTLGRRTMLVNARKMYRPGNGTDTVLLALEDVTERIDAAEKLQRRALLLESMGDAVIAGDLDFRIQEWNPAAERLLGWTVSEVRGRTLDEVFAVQGVDRTDARADVRRGRTLHLQIRVQHRSGRWLDIEVSSMPVNVGGVPTGFVSVLQDVSERTRLERESQQRFAELQAANRELESFSYSVSHDLRAPVRAIAGFSRLLEEDYGKVLDEEGLRLLRVVRKNAQRMGVLIDDLLAFARTGRQAMTVEDVDMEALAREAVDEAQAAEPGREYDVSVGPLPGATADKSLVALVWQNLLANAVKYSRGRTPAVIAVSAEPSENEVVYRVSDNGVGFDMRHSGRLFRVFERLHAPAEFEGTGVGLALVDRIVHRHGGRAWAEASPGRGATFFFSLPKGNKHE